MHITAGNYRFLPEKKKKRESYKCRHLLPINHPYGLKSPLNFRVINYHLPKQNDTVKPPSKSNALNDHLKIKTADVSRQGNNKI